MEKVAGGWRRLHNEDDRVEMGDVYGACSAQGTDEKCVQYFG